MEKVYKEDLIKLINEINHPIWIYDYENYRFLSANKCAVELLGYSIDELLKLTIVDIGLPEEAEYFKKHKSWKVYRFGVDKCFKLKKKSGDLIYAEVTSKDILYMKRPAKISTIYDHTERIQYEHRLKKSEERLKVSQELSLDGFTILNPIYNDSGEIIDFEWDYVNPAASRMLHTPASELIGQRLLTIHPGNSTDLFNLYRKVAQTGIPHDIEIQYSSDNISGWFRNMAVKIGDGVAVSFHEVTERKINQDLIEQKSREMNNIIERISDAFIALDKNWDLTYLNSTSQKILNCNDSVLGKNFWNEFPVFCDTPVEVSFRKAMEEQEAQIFDTEGKIQPRWYRVSVFPSPDGLTVYWVDTTLSRAYEEQLIASLKQKEILLKEVHHRIKNNLQIIISILNLQSYYVNDPAALEIFRQSQNRIRSMALIHEKLYKSENLSSVNLENYISDIVKYLFASYSISDEVVDVSFNMERIELDSNTAISFGLIVNELVSNSLKYAFTAEETKGLIRISASNTEEGIIFEFSDNGKGFPQDVDYKSTTTLGLQLVNTLVDQLNGELHLVNGKGTTFRIGIPYGR